MQEKIKKEISWSILSKGISFALFIGANIVLTRGLGVDAYGRWSYFLSVLHIMILIVYAGLNRSSEKYIAQYRDQKEIREVLICSFIERLALSLLLVGIFFLFKDKIIVFFKQTIEYKHFWIIGLLCFLGSFVEWFKKVFNGLHRLKYCFYINILEFGAKLFFLIVFFFYSVTVLSAVKAYTLSFIITVSLGFVFLIKNFILKSPINHEVIEPPLWKEILRYSMPLFLFNFGFLFVCEIDTVMLGFLSSSDQVGYYSAAKQVVGKLPHISLAISMGLTPVFANITKENVGQKRNLLKKALKANGLLFGAISVCVVFGAAYIVRLLFGVQYLPSAEIMKILIVYAVVFSFSKYFTSILMYQGKAAKVVCILFICTMINIGLNYLLIPLYGAKGAAISSSIAYVPYTIINYLFVRRLLDKKSK